MDHEGIRADLYTLGKTLGGGIVPVSAVVGRADVLGVLDDHVMVGELLALGEVKPVENALQPFTRQVRANVVPRQSRAERE